jgi:hypothetical protein
MGSCEYCNKRPGSINAVKFYSNCPTGGFSRRASLHGVKCLIKNPIKEKDYLQNLGLDGIILSWNIRETGYGAGDWIILTQKKIKWRTFLNTIINLRVCRKEETPLSPE